MKTGFQTSNVLNMNSIFHSIFDNSVHQLAKARLGSSGNQGELPDVFIPSLLKWVVTINLIPILFHDV